MADARLRDAAVELDGVGAGNAERDFDAVRLEQQRQDFAAACHTSSLRGAGWDAAITLPAS